MRYTVYLAPALALAAALAILGSALGYRIGLWSLNPAFAVLRAGAVAAAAGAVLSLTVALWAFYRGRRRLLTVSLTGLLAGALAFGVPYATLRMARGLPAIHDVTTDTANPPAFIALRAARLASPNGVEYGGRHVAEDQRANYPDIAPLTYANAPALAYERCLEIARSRSWRVAEADAQALRIEATDRTLFFGFRDDVVIRITPLAGGKASRVDLRSVSRVGGADFGVNARRVRGFLRELASAD